MEEKNKELQSLWFFNKEILLGEVGAIIGAQIASFCSFIFKLDHHVTSMLTVAGSLAGSLIGYTGTRIYHQKKMKTLSIEKFTKDVIFYSPAAFILTITVYYPTLYFLDSFFLDKAIHAMISAFIAQFSAFFLFLICINIYRLILAKIAKHTL